MPTSPSEFRVLVEEIIALLRQPPAWSQGPYEVVLVYRDGKCFLNPATQFSAIGDGLEACVCRETGLTRAALAREAGVSLAVGDATAFYLGDNIGRSGAECTDALRKYYTAMRNALIPRDGALGEPTLENFKSRISNTVQAARDAGIVVPERIASEVASGFRRTQINIRYLTPIPVYETFDTWFRELIGISRIDLARVAGVTTPSGMSPDCGSIGDTYKYYCELEWAVVVHTSPAREAARGVHPKYELYTTASGQLRIKALRPITGQADAGDIGGHVANENSLSQDGECWLGADARIEGDARVEGNALVVGASVIKDHAKVTGDAKVYDSTIQTFAQVGGFAEVRRSEVGAATVIGGTARLHGADLGAQGILMYKGELGGGLVMPELSPGVATTPMEFRQVNGEVRYAEIPAGPGLDLFIREPVRVPTNEDFQALVEEMLDWLKRFNATEPPEAGEIRSELDEIGVESGRQGRAQVRVLTPENWVSSLETYVLTAIGKLRGDIATLAGAPVDIGWSAVEVPMRGRTEQEADLVLYEYMKTLRDELVFSPRLSVQGNAPAVPPATHDVPDDLARLKLLFDEMADKAYPMGLVLQHGVPRTFAYSYTFLEPIESVSAFEHTLLNFLGLTRSDLERRHRLGFTVHGLSAEVGTRENLYKYYKALDNELDAYITAQRVVTVTDFIEVIRGILARVPQAGNATLPNRIRRDESVGGYFYLEPHAEVGAFEVSVLTALGRTRDGIEMEYHLPRIDGTSAQMSGEHQDMWPALLRYYQILNKLVNELPVESVPTPLPSEPESRPRRRTRPRRIAGGLRMPQDSVEGFKFGADPEFHLLDSRGRRIPAEDYFPRDTYSDNPPEVGCNGHAATAELRSNRPFDRLSEMFTYFSKTLLKRAYESYLKEAAPDTVFTFTPFLETTEEMAGGHISISHTSQEWYISGQALYVLPFWFGIFGTLLNKANERRYRQYYGVIGDLECKPFGRMRGVEYRNLAPWEAPPNTEYRKMITKMIITILSAPADALAAQVNYVKEVHMLATSSRLNYALRSYGRRDLIDDWSEFMDKIRRDPVAVVNALHTTAVNLNYHEMDWLLEYLPQGEGFQEYNPVVIWSPRAAGNYRERPRFETVGAALMAIIDAYRTESARGRVARFHRLGETYAPRFGVGWVQETVRDYLTGDVDTVARDVNADDIATCSTGLAVSAVQSLHRKFDLTMTRPMRVLGAAPTHGTPEVQFLFPGNEHAFINCPALRQLCRVEAVTTGGWTISNDIGVKMEMRMSPSYLRYIVPTAYILYRLGYIKNIGNELLSDEYLRLPRLADDEPEYVVEEEGEEGEEDEEAGGETEEEGSAQGSVRLGLLGELFG